MTMTNKMEDTLTEINLHIVAAVQPNNFFQRLLLGRRLRFVYADYVELPMAPASLKKFDIPSYREQGTYMADGSPTGFVVCTVKEKDVIEFLNAMADYEDRVSKFDKELIEQMNMFTEDEEGSD